MPKMKSHISCLLKLLSIFFKATTPLPNGAHYGNQFVLSFPRGGQDVKSDNGLLELHMASREKVRVTVQKKTGKIVPDEEVVVQPDVETVHPVTLQLGEQKLYTIYVEAIVVKVEADKKIALYVMNTPENGGSEGFLVLSTEALGTHYSFGFWSIPLGETNHRLTSRATITSAHGNKDQTNTIIIVTPSVETEDWINPPAPTSQFQEVYPGDRIFVDLPPYGVYHISQHAFKESYTVYSTLPIAVMLSNPWWTMDDSSSRYGHMVEMIPPYGQFGHRAHVHEFLWFAVAPESGGRLEVAGRTTKDEFTNSVLKSSNMDFKTVVTSIDKSAKPKPVMFLATSVNKATGMSPVLLYVPPVEQYMNYYLFVIPTSPTSLRKRDGTTLPYKNRVIVFGEDMDWKGLRFNEQPFKDAEVKREKDLTYGLRDSVPPGAHELTHVKPNVNFGVVVTGVNSRGDGYAFPAGLRHALTHQACEPTKGDSPGDGVDNDCDGKTDEEVLNSSDDDNDGKTDEDLADESKSYKRTGRVTPIFGASKLEEERGVHWTRLHIVLPVALSVTIFVLAILFVFLKREFKTVKLLLNRVCCRAEALEAKKPVTEFKLSAKQPVNVFGTAAAPLDTDNASSDKGLMEKHQARTLASVKDDVPVVDLASVSNTSAVESWTVNSESDIELNTEDGTDEREGSSAY